MGNTLMQHRLAIAGFKMPGLKLSWRKRMKEFKDRMRQERAGSKLQAEARNGMKMLVLPLLWIATIVLPLLWMCSFYTQVGESINSIIPPSMSCLGDSVLEKVRKCQNKSSWQQSDSICNIFPKSQIPVSVLLN